MPLITVRAALLVGCNKKKLGAEQEWYATAGFDRTTAYITSNLLNIVLTTIAIILVVLWTLGFITGTMMGGFILILTMMAVIIVFIRLYQGRELV